MGASLLACNLHLLQMEPINEQVDEDDDGPDLNMVCSSITEVEPVSRSCFSNLAIIPVNICFVVM